MPLGPSAVCCFGWGNVRLVAQTMRDRDATAVGTILDDGTGPGPFGPNTSVGPDDDRPAFSVGDVSISEGGLMTFTVTRTDDNQLKLEIPSDISFDVGRADIKSNFRPVLERFAQTLNANPNTEVRIIGHTDSTGSLELNQNLSNRRAQSVASYLSANGVAASRLSSYGAGPNQPIASNANEAGRAQNRRVEINLRPL